MAEFRLLENGFAGHGLGSLFHTPAYFDLHADGQGRYFEWLQGERVLACVHFTPTAPGHWRSPARGTFAGYAVQSELRQEDLLGFHEAVMARLVALGAGRIEILPAPMAHDPAAFANQIYLLRARGFEITQCDLNQSLELNALPFAERISYGNLKRLRKCHREGLSATRLPLSALSQVYNTLSTNRASKGHAMSMSLAQLQAMAERFAEHMLLFGCRDGEHLAAAALCLRLNPNVMYVFYWGDQPGYATLSPVVSVAEAIHLHCQETGIRLIDVGTSTIDREPNFGLLQFKRGLGFTESLKLRMGITL